MKWTLFILAVMFALLFYTAYRVGQQPHSEIRLDSRYWECTKTRTVPIGMAMGQECAQWTMKP